MYSGIIKLEKEIITQKFEPYNDDLIHIIKSIYDKHRKKIKKLSKTSACQAKVMMGSCYALTPSFVFDKLKCENNVQIE